MSPLLFAGDGETAIVVGSNFGQEHHPAWTGNLLAQPRATIITGGETIPVTAELLEGDEAEAAYQQMVEVTAVYAAYRRRTDRSIRVFRLTPIRLLTYRRSVIERPAARPLRSNLVTGRSSHRSTTPPSSVGSASSTSTICSA